MNTATQKSIQTEKNQCIENCLEFNRTGLETIAYCLQEGGRHTEASLMKILHDSVEICQTSADFMIRNSTFYSQICAVCAEICVNCADACEQETMAGDNMMKECAESCRRVAESCRPISSIIGI